MTMVGPRPEVPKYADLYTPEQRAILQYKPGITDNASLHFRNEEQLLRSAGDVEEFYIRYCLPRKLELNQQYQRDAGFFPDLLIILQTVSSVALNYSPPIRVWLLITLYTLQLAASLWMAYELRFDFAAAPEDEARAIVCAALARPLQQLFLGASALTPSSLFQHARPGQDLSR